MKAIEVKNINKSYGRVQALSDVSFAVGKGEVFGLIGPDGAGKTSMFRSVAGWGICRASSRSTKTSPSRRT